MLSSEGLLLFYIANQSERSGRQFVINMINATSVSRVTGAYQNGVRLKNVRRLYRSTHQNKQARRKFRGMIINERERLGDLKKGVVVS